MEKKLKLAERERLDPLSGIAVGRWAKGGIVYLNLGGYISNEKPKEKEIWNSIVALTKNPKELTSSERKKYSRYQELLPSTDATVSEAKLALRYILMSSKARKDRSFDKFKEDVKDKREIAQRQNEAYRNLTTSNNDLLMRGYADNYRREAKTIRDSKTGEYRTETPTEYASRELPGLKGSRLESFEKATQYQDPEKTPQKTLDYGEKMAKKYGWGVRMSDKKYHPVDVIEGDDPRSPYAKAAIEAYIEKEKKTVEREQKRRDHKSFIDRRKQIDERRKADAQRTAIEATEQLEDPNVSDEQKARIRAEMEKNGIQPLYKDVGPEPVPPTPYDVKDETPEQWNERLKKYEADKAVYDRKVKANETWATPTFTEKDEYGETDSPTIERPVEISKGLGQALSEAKTESQMRKKQNPAAKQTTTPPTAPSPVEKPIPLLSGATFNTPEEAGEALERYVGALAPERRVLADYERTRGTDSPPAAKKLEDVRVRTGGQTTNTRPGDSINVAALRATEAKASEAYSMSEYVATGMYERRNKAIADQKIRDSGKTSSSPRDSLAQREQFEASIRLPTSISEPLEREVRKDIQRFWDRNNNTWKTPEMMAAEYGSNPDDEKRLRLYQEGNRTFEKTVRDTIYEGQYQPDVWVPSARTNLRRDGLGAKHPWNEAARDAYNRQLGLLTTNAVETTSQASTTGEFPVTQTMPKRELIPDDKRGGPAPWTMQVDGKDRVMGPRVWVTDVPVTTTADAKYIPLDKVRTPTVDRTGNVISRDGQKQQKKEMLDWVK